VGNVSLAFILIFSSGKMSVFPALRQKMLRNASCANFISLVEGSVHLANWQKISMNAILAVVLTSSSRQVINVNCVFWQLRRIVTIKNALDFYLPTVNVQGRKR
jgi:TATA-box binding protein (TBP) (component of TFIID and TFIIIB)